MSDQLEISFIHAHENNGDSKRHLEENRNHFSNQCSLLMKVFERGERLTTRDAMLNYNIGHLPRRIKDLVDHNGVDIDFEWITDENKTRYKVYFLKK